jgi:hypothetical protein
MAKDWSADKATDLRWRSSGSSLDEAAGRFFSVPGLETGICACSPEKVSNVSKNAKRR